MYLILIIVWKKIFLEFRLLYVFIMVGVGMRKYSCIVNLGSRFKKELWILVYGFD